MSDETTTTIDMPHTTQGIVIFDGTEYPVVLTDEVAPIDAREYLSDTLTRRVVVERLRYWADVLSQDAPADD